MKRKRILILFVVLLLGVLAASTLLTPLRRSGSVRAANDKPKGRLTKVFRKTKENKNDPLPDWVDAAFKKGKGHLKQGGREWSKQLLDVESELDVQTAEEDDLGETRVRAGQIFNGVPVVGGQLIIHEDANGFRDTDGRGFGAARAVDTKPKLKPKDALDVAEAALVYNGKFANEPQANLVILPNEVIDRKKRVGANLVYVVELLVEDDPSLLGRHFYYIDANDGHIVWNYNGLATVNGNSLYSGQVTVPTRPVNGEYWLQDPTRGATGLADVNTLDQSFTQAQRDSLKQGGNWTTDLRQRCDHPLNDPHCTSTDRKVAIVNIGQLFTSTTDAWGDGLPYQHAAGDGSPQNPNEQTAAVDAQFASTQHWDYFHNTYGRDGIDGQNFRMLTRVHWAQRNDFAFWNGRGAGFGDGSTDPGLPWTTLDIVAHEISHGLFEKALAIDDADHPFIYTLETAAINESFADIFGTAVEFYVRERQCIPCPANPGTYRACEQRAGVSCLLGNYYQGEDQKNGTVVFRDMANPAVSSYSNINYATNDQGQAIQSPHQMGSIQSKVFWLLAQTGTNTWNGVSVTGIGRATAEDIFYRALTQRLSYADSSFASVRKATLAAASNPPYVYGGQEYNAVAQAWDSVGVPANQIDGTTFFVAQQYADFLNRSPDPSGLAFWINNIDSCTPKPSCIEVQRVNTSAAYFLSIEFQETGYLVERMYKVAYGDATGTSTYQGSHQLSVPKVRFGEFQPDQALIALGPFECRPTCSVIVGQPGWETRLENNKQAFALTFVQRSRFTSAFPTSLTPAQFVDALNANAGNVLSSNDRTNAINLFGGALDTSNLTARAQAVRQVAENQTLKSNESNRAFVLMQYFGYLRRNPNSGQDSDWSGYDYWLDKLNQFGGNYINAQMVQAFIDSTEYRQRFGQL